jgi:hypothetical protein
MRNPATSNVTLDLIARLETLLATRRAELERIAAQTIASAEAAWFRRPLTASVER